MFLLENDNSSLYKFKHQNRSNLNCYPTPRKTSFMGYKTVVWQYLTPFIRHFIHTKLYYDYIENIYLHEKSHQREIKSKNTKKYPEIKFKFF